uniref:Uncharacterized protein n=1 Tax=Rhizophora mucronata TaxID=61149 RepID=A0A2P2KRL4_RHIMU
MICLGEINMQVRKSSITPVNEGSNLESTNEDQLVGSAMVLNLVYVVINQRILATWVICLFSYNSHSLTQISL